MDSDSATLAAASCLIDTDADDKSESSAGCNSPADADDDGDDMYGDLGDEAAIDEAEEDGEAGAEDLYDDLQCEDSHASPSINQADGILLLITIAAHLNVQSLTK